MNIRFRKLHSTEAVPYGSTLLPKSNDAAINEIKTIVAGVPGEMRRLAVAGADDDEPSSPLRLIRLGTEECLGREARETSQDMRNLEAQFNTIEALDPDLQLAGVDVTIVNETRQRQDDTIAAKATAVRKRMVYHAFRSSREIDRDPETPNAWLTVFSIVLALAIEFGIGYWLYNDVSADAIAAMGMAALLSLVVAATALATGFFGVRGAFHGFGGRERVTGSIITATGLFAILYLALMISHDRDHLASFAPDQDFIRRFDWTLIFHPADWFKYETVEGPLFLVILRP
ncbi:hypothetical protein [Pseudomonas putida]|uniref:hypothetical protein n=1 Tax=Pseudomonas putida TaxID=303 RepID=UPI000CD3B3F7|nr:hypothetical protein [Pseudomonas putida]POG16957.1 hypothetical protein BGP85_27780 [Pseudomonas putida]